MKKIKLKKNKVTVGYSNCANKAPAIKKVQYATPFSYVKLARIPKPLTQKCAVLWLILLHKGNLSHSQTHAHMHSFTGAEFTMVKGEVWRKTRAKSLNIYYIFHGLISVALSAIK